MNELLFAFLIFNWLGKLKIIKFKHNWQTSGFLKKITLIFIYWLTCVFLEWLISISNTSALEFQCNILLILTIIYLFDVILILNNGLEIIILW